MSWPAKSLRHRVRLHAWLTRHNGAPSMVYASASIASAAERVALSRSATNCSSTRLLRQRRGGSNDARILIRASFGRSDRFNGAVSHYKRTMLA